MMTMSTIEADRARLEAVARWNQQRAQLARNSGQEQDAARHHDNAMACRLRSSWPVTR